MVVRFVNKSVINHCIMWLESLNEYIKTYYPAVYNNYKSFIDGSDKLCLELKLKKHVSANTFFELNDWFCCYANGLEGFDLQKIDINNYNLLMEFTTKYCFEYSDLDKDEREKTIYKII